MLAPRRLPSGFAAWNRRWGAPDGRTIRGLGRLTGRSQQDLRWRFPRWTGPFGFQANNSTRRFEYPWAFHAVPVTDATTVVDLGGGLCGLQFVLARAGAAVTNVDPGEAATGRGWAVGADAIARLNRAFRTDVRLISATLEDAGLAAGSVDTVYSISTVEHIPPAELPGLMDEIRRVLRPGGALVMTVDLFLDLEPFCSRTENQFGTNVSVRDLVRRSGLDMVVGRPDELLGYPGFDPAAVLARLEELLVGAYPAMAQCVVLRKPAAP